MKIEPVLSSIDGYRFKIDDKIVLEIGGTAVSVLGINLPQHGHNQECYECIMKQFDIEKMIDDLLKRNSNFKKIIIDSESCYVDDEKLFQTNELKKYIEYKIEEIKVIVEGNITTQIISILHDRELGKKTKREMNTDAISSLKKYGVDFENPEKLLGFFIYLQEHHLGLYLLLKTSSYNLLLVNPEDCDDIIFSEKEFGMSKTDYGVFIRGINTILFLLEAIYHTEREGGGTIALHIRGMCKEILENTFETVAKMNGIHKDDLEFIPCLDRLKSKNKGWAFYLERIQEILSENETLVENVKYFQQWWNGNGGGEIR